MNRKNTPFVILMMGHTGSGKSTLAKKLAKLLGCELFHSAVTRKELGLGPLSKEHAQDDFFDLTSPAREPMDRQVYQENARRVARALKLGNNAILDAGNFFAWQRTLLYERVWMFMPDIFIIRVICPEPIIIERLKSRLAAYEQDPLNETPSIKTYHSAKAATQPPDGNDTLPDGNVPTIIEYDSHHATVRIVQDGHHAKTALLLHAITQ